MNVALELAESAVDRCGQSKGAVAVGGERLNREGSHRKLIMGSRILVPTKVN